jgi:hypothetical protein
MESLTKKLTSSKAVMVMPAFETNPKDNLTEAHALADGAAMLNKTELLKLVDKDDVYQFHVRNYRMVRAAYHAGHIHFSRVSQCAAPCGASDS